MQDSLPSVAGSAALRQSGQHIVSGGSNILHSIPNIENSIYGSNDLQTGGMSGFDHASQLSDEIASGVPQPQLYD